MEFNKKLAPGLLVLVGMLWGLITTPAMASDSDRQDMIRQRFEVEIAELEKEIRQLKDELSSARKKIEELKDTVADRDKKINQLKQEGSKPEESRRQLKEQRENMETRVSKQPENSAENNGRSESTNKNENVSENDQQENDNPGMEDALLNRQQIKRDDINRSGKLWVSGGHNYSIRRFPLDYKLTIITRTLDSLSKLAHQYYRDASYSIKIYRANKNKLPSPENLPAQTRLRLPPYQELTGRPLDLSVRENPGKVIEEDLQRSGELWKEKNQTYPLRRQPLDYELQIFTNSRDNLTRLAHQYYGNSAYWRKLYKMNSERVENPNILPSGTRLRLPPLAELKEVNL